MARISTFSINPGINRGTGLTLIELMIALALGLLLVAGMVQFFAGNKVSFRTNEGIARIQENGRFTLETLKSDLREAGTLGFCAGQVQIENHLNDSCGGGISDFFNPNLAIIGWEFSDTGRGDDYDLPEDGDLNPAIPVAGDWSSTASTSSLPVPLGGLVVPGSDVLSIRRMQPASGFTGADTNDRTSATINLTADHNLNQDDLVLVTNCTRADLFQNTSSAADSFSRGGGSCTSPGPGNKPPGAREWASTYADDMQAFVAGQLVYFVGRSPTTGRPALFRWNISAGAVGTPDELVDGVDNMQVLYGYSRAAPAGDGQSVNEWLTANDVPANGWPQVIAIRIALSMRSADIADGDRSAIVYDLAGTNVNVTGDGFLRQPFSATIALRNRVLVN